jgi:rRNA maturation protein Nop10
MPYLNCTKCRLSVYSAAVYTTIDSCPRCGSALSVSAPRLLAVREMRERLGGQRRAKRRIEKRQADAPRPQA